MKALLQQYGDHNDDRAHSRDSPRRGLVELSRVAATSTSRHPETKPQTSPTANFFSNPRSKWRQQNPTSRLSIASCTEIASFRKENVRGRIHEDSDLSFLFCPLRGFGARRFNTLEEYGHANPLGGGVQLWGKDQAHLSGARQDTVPFADVSSSHSSTHPRFSGPSLLKHTESTVHVSRTNLKVINKTSYCQSKKVHTDGLARIRTWTRRAFTPHKNHSVSVD
ncbi:hypothetical protein BHE74_00004315 [Ensete ventricosum]|nr:hypothetical protein BHE74_00004315 [Ensete ventricosum]